MKNIKIVTSLTLMVIAAFVSAFTILNDNDKIVKKQGKSNIAANAGFAVVELFTSEGCSSCPPADALIERLEKEIVNKPVYILAYHVDYWNRLGWIDPFSKAEYSERQNNYAEWLKLSSVYTPQVVVNGKTEFVGSQEGTLRNAITTNLKTAAKNELSLMDLSVSGGKAKVSYQTDELTGKSALILALVKKNAVVKVKNGENGGRTLSHVQIVNDIHTIPAAKTGQASISLPADFSAKNYEIIAFIQDTQTGTINGATKAVFPNNN